MGHLLGGKDLGNLDQGTFWGYTAFTFWTAFQKLTLFAEEKQRQISNQLRLNLWL